MEAHTVLQGIAAKMVGYLPQVEVTAEREIDLWSLLVWVYQRQRAHARLHSPFNWFHWTIATVAPDDAATRTRVARDAARVHATVLQLPQEQAEMIVLFAEQGMQPEWTDRQVRLVGRRRRDHGGGTFEQKGEWFEIAPIRLSPEERERVRLDNAPIQVRRKEGRRGQQVEWLYHADPRPVRVRRKGKLVDYGDVRPAGWGSGFAVFSPWCPVDESPAQVVIDRINATYDAWQGAMVALAGLMREVPLTGYRITPSKVDPRPVVAK